MAKKTNKANLSIEEMLEQAKVVSENQPYNIPENWCWIKLGVVCTLDKGETNLNENLTYFDAKTLRTDKKIDLRNSGVIVKKGQKVILVDGENSGEVFVIPYRGYMGSTFRILNISNNIDDTFIQYFIDHKADTLKNNKIGSAIPHLNKDLFYGLELPLSPLLEQHRIVEHIETLFSKLDEAKEKAQEILDTFEMRKASILNNAFSGKLTEKWRKEHKIELDSWEVKSINDLCLSLKYGTSKKSKTDGSVVVIRMGNLQQGEIDWNDLAYSDDIEDIEKYKLSPGDVLFNRTNSAALVGKTSIYRGNYPAIYAGYLIKLDYDHELIIGDYLNYALNTTRAKEYCNTVKTDGVNQSNINAKKIGSFEIPIATIKEQQEIVKILYTLLKKEKEAKQIAESLIEQIDLMKKSILSKAFRGELGTNNPKDENAEELLKRILTGDTNANKKSICKEV